MAPIRDQHDALIYTASNSTTIYLYDSEVRRTKKNAPISFVQPLLADPTSSQYNLGQIKTVFYIKAFVYSKFIANSGFSTFTITTPTEADTAEGLSAGTYHTIDSLMNKTNCTLRWRSSSGTPNTLTGLITDFTVIETPGQEQTYGNWPNVSPHSGEPIDLGNYIEVEIGFEVGVSL